MTDAAHLPLSHLSASSPQLFSPFLRLLFFKHHPALLCQLIPQKKKKKRSHTHTCLRSSPPLRHLETISGKMSHLQPRWKRTLTDASLFPSSSVTVWTLMKKRWVLVCAPIYLSEPRDMHAYPHLSIFTTCTYFSNVHSIISHLILVKIKIL